MAEEIKSRLSQAKSAEPIVDDARNVFERVAHSMGRLRSAKANGDVLASCLMVLVSISALMSHLLAVAADAPVSTPT